MVVPTQLATATRRIPAPADIAPFVLVIRFPQICAPRSMKYQLAV
jgi:hypothetical protein